MVKSEDSGQADTLALAFSPEGETVVSTGSGKMRVWNVSTSGLRSEIPVHRGWIRMLVFSPDGAMLLTGCGNGTIEMWETNTYTRKSTIKPHTGQIQEIKFSADGRTLATGSMDGTILLWHWASLAQQNKK